MRCMWSVRVVSRHRLRLRVRRKKRKAGVSRQRRVRESGQRLRLRGGFLGGHFAFGDQVL